MENDLRAARFGIAGRQLQTPAPAISVEAVVGVWFNQ